MLFWLTILGFTVILPLVVLILRRNFITFLLCYVPGFIAVFIRNRMICQADHYSEACTWAYLNYLGAVAIGAGIYVLVSIIQVLLKRIKQSS